MKNVTQREGVALMLVVAFCITAIIAGLHDRNLFENGERKAMPAGIVVAPVTINSDTRDLKQLRVDLQRIALILGNLALQSKGAVCHCHHQCHTPKVLKRCPRNGKH